MSDKDGETIFVKFWKNSGLVGTISGPRISEGEIIELTDLKVDEWEGKLNLTATALTEVNFPEEDESEYPEASSSGGYQSKSLAMIHEGDFVESVGKIVKIYPNKFYYDSCPNPNCKKGIKIREVDERTEYFCEKGCSEALTQPPVPVARINGLFNDGYVTLRFTAMGKNAEKIIGLDSDKIKEEFDALYNGSEKEDDWEKVRDAGEVFVEAFESRMKEGFHKIKAVINMDKKYRGNIEMMINDIQEVDYKEESEKIKTRIMELIEEPA